MDPLRCRRGDRTEEQLRVQLALLSELVSYAQDAMQLAAEDAQVFMALYAVLRHRAAEKRETDPALRQLAESALRQTAAAVSCEQQETAVQLLVTVWSAGLRSGCEAEQWATSAPELPAKCLRAATTSTPPSTPTPTPTPTTYRTSRPTA
ncbi:hypothetical protein [Streptomyces sp. NBC_01304]|uniref:hypothetical protein n=1 Tax=Streptomyces sp. NBC_01304 TaxID=2903818 RepID=UPI002E159EC4|nr:hypothetical protein OG430_03530 [Streptomyces sp. NBC_01304]